jgi:hypothetical protein
MKRALFIGLFIVSVVACRSAGQGIISLDNYYSIGPNVHYGSPDIPRLGVNGGVAPGPAEGLISGWTMGFYYTLGNVTGSVASDPTQIADPSTLGGNLNLAIGTGSTALFWVSGGVEPGEGVASSFFVVPGTSAGGGDTITVIVTAYSGVDYVSAPYRGHSNPFTMMTSAAGTQWPNKTGTYMSSFSVYDVPEPTMFAFAVLFGFILQALRVRRTSL